MTKKKKYSLIIIIIIVLILIWIELGVGIFGSPFAGTLASHIKALETANYINVEKQFIDRKPNTRYSATKLGKAEFKKHINALEKLIKKGN